MHHASRPHDDNVLNELSRNLALVKTTARLLNDSPQDISLWSSLHCDVLRMQTFSQLANLHSLRPYVSDLVFLFQMRDEGLLSISPELLTLVLRNIESIDGQLASMTSGTSAASALDAISAEIDDVLMSQMLPDDWFCPPQMVATAEDDIRSNMASSHIGQARTSSNRRACLS